jgi:hypothetical protein
MGSDKIVCAWKRKMILKNRWVNNLKYNIITVADGELKCEKTRFCGRRKKSTVRDFSTPILTKMMKKWFIAIYGKTAPTKSTVLGPGPPPCDFINFIEKSGFFWFLGLQYSRENRHQSRHLRPTPPAEDPKKWHFSKFIDF